MENVVKGWFLTGLGVILTTLGLVHLSGFYVMPNPELLDAPWKVGIYFLVALCLVVFPKTKIESWLEAIAQSAFSIFKKKSE